MSGAALGAAAAASMLVRVNGVALIATLVLAALFFPSPRGAKATQMRARFAVALAVALFALLAPWLARQQLRYGRPSLVDYPEARFVYLAQHGLIDPELPRFAPYRARFDPDDGRSAYAILEQLRARRLAPALARFRPIAEIAESARIFSSGFEVADPDGWSAWSGGEPRPVEPKQASQSPRPWLRLDPTTELVEEQIAAQPAGVRRARVRSAVAFAGLSGGSPAALWGQSDRHDAVRAALQEFERSEDALAGQRAPLSRWLPGAEGAHSRRGLELWGSFLLGYLVWGRALLALASSVSIALLLTRRRLASVPLLASLAVGWSATLALHAWHLAALERFAVIFDPVSLLATLLAVRALLVRGPEDRFRAD